MQCAVLCETKGPIQWTKMGLCVVSATALGILSMMALHGQIGSMPYAACTIGLVSAFSLGTVAFIGKDRLERKPELSALALLTITGLALGILGITGVLTSSQLSIGMLTVIGISGALGLASHLKRKT